MMAKSDCFWTGGIAQVVKVLALHSNPSTKKKKKKNYF
jgi:hypothetical protein